jgi:hypothetical protein
MLAAVFFIFSPRAKTNMIVIFALIYWLLVVMFTGGEADLLPWYRFPAFPFLAITCAWGIVYLVQNANFFTSFLAAGLLLGNRTLLVNAFRSNVTPIFYRLSLIFLLLPSLSNLIFNKLWLQRISQMIIIFVVVIGMYFNVVYIYNQFEINCQNIGCPMVPSTRLSTLYFPFLWHFLVLK